MTTPNHVHMQVALQEAQTQMQLMLQRAQQLAVELYEERQLTAALRQALEAKSVGTDSKSEET